MALGAKSCCSRLDGRIRDSQLLAQRLLSVMRCEINRISTALASYQELFFFLTLLITVGNPVSNFFFNSFFETETKILGFFVLFLVGISVG